MMMTSSKKIRQNEIAQYVKTSDYEYEYEKEKEVIRNEMFVQ